MSNEDLFAFPTPASEYGGHGTAFGMTLRDYFAAGFAQAQATATSADTGFMKPEYVVPEAGLPGKKSVAQIIAETSYALADAMLAARNA
ncbi:hypothetical protein AO069_15885 [Pseudomonas syringae pv. syringae PD2774]|uniref:hypothetical protein n=1 Tax=Pseudomonas syringae TaxID=317 RepID=UPI000737398C|nr:hypothetical protein [Pseudomonas syringae]KTB93671.1 hypothetical protein AO069_15885 [Pseudomonas syringae pv. syringae PD2774]